MDSKASAAPSGILFYRRSRGFYLAIAAMLAGIAGVCLGIFGPAPHVTDKGLAPSLAQMCAGAGLGCIWAAIFLNFLWGLTSQGRYFATIFTAMPIAFLLIFLWPPQLGIVAAGAVALGGAALFFYEKGMTLQFGPQGARRIRLFPWKAERHIPWDKLESVMTDLRRITTYGPGGFFAENENRLVLTGNGHRLAWDTTRYESVREDLLNQVDRARPFAVASTIDRLDKTGSVRLGPIEMRKDALLIKWSTGRPVRPKSPLFHILASLLTCGLWLLGLAIAFVVRRAKQAARVPLESISQATFEKGFLLIAANRKYYLPLRRVPNGIYFPDLIDAIRPQAAAFKPSSGFRVQGA